MVEIKAHSVLEAVATYRLHLPAECKQVLELLDPETRALVTEARSNEWIPLDAFVRYLQAQVDVTGADAYALHTERSKVVVERQLRGIYKFFAWLSSPQSLIARLSTVNAIFFRGVEVERTAVQENEVVLRYRGFEAAHRLIEPIILGFFRGVLEVNGAKDVRTEFTRHIGSPDYAELVVSWS